MQTDSTSLYETPIRDLLCRTPALSAVFINRRMQCVGCEMSQFDTLRDAAREYSLNWDDLSAEVLRIIQENNHG